LDRIAAMHPKAPLDQIHAIIGAVAERFADPNYRGWHPTNAAVELPDPDHPARQVCQIYKQTLRSRLCALAQDAKLREPDRVADGLLMLIEGAAASRHTFDAGGPSRHFQAIAIAVLAGHRNEEI
jgi:hypothetical protein